VIVAIDVLKWPGMNVQFIVSLVATLVLTLAVIPYGKRRPPGTRVSWGESMFAAVYVFAVFLLAYAVVPHQWLTHEQNQLNWRADRIWIGRSTAAEVLHVSWLPFDITFQALGDIIVVLIYSLFLGLQIYMWHWWQNRGKTKPAVAELPTSAYGRPLVKKG
jgi:hypothetical protein